MKSTIITTHLPPRLSRRVAVDEEPLFFCTKIPPSFFCNVRLFFLFSPLFLIEKLLWWPETRRQQTPLNRVVAFYLIYIFWEWISLFYVVGFAHKRAEQSKNDQRGFSCRHDERFLLLAFLLSDRVLLTAYTLLIYDRRRSQKVEYCSS